MLTPLAFEFDEEKDPLTQDVELTVEQKVEALLNDDDEFREMCFEYLDSLIPTLQAMARSDEYDGDFGYALHKELRHLVKYRVRDV